jgi:hypothetical protein
MRTKSAAKQQRKILANVSLLSHTKNKALEPPSKLFRELSFVIQSSPPRTRTQSRYSCSTTTTITPDFRLPRILRCQQTGVPRQIEALTFQSSTYEKYDTQFSILPANARGVTMTRRMTPPLVYRMATQSNKTIPMIDLRRKVLKKNASKNPSDSRYRKTILET